MHQTVLKQLAIDLLQVQPAPAWYIDATFGGGGHSRELLDRGAQVIAFDFDQEVIDRAQTAFAADLAAGRLVLIRENFTKMATAIAQQQQLQNLPPQLPIRGVLFDFGTNSDQLMSAERGFSFAGDGNLDMRLDQRLGVTAQDLLLALPEKELARLFFEFGGEPQSRAIARAIVRYRQSSLPAKPFQSNQELVEIIFRVKGRQPQGAQHNHPATKVFQALRIAVNNEIENIELALQAAFDLLAPGGRLVTIAFHDGEDRPVKQFMRQQAQAETAQLITKKPLSPSAEELKENPRSRSAKLRVLEKVSPEVKTN